LCLILIVAGHTAGFHTIATDNRQLYPTKYRFALRKWLLEEQCHVKQRR
jgi:hypothetical protein